jgi:hypothetical protein
MPLASQRISGFGVIARYFCDADENSHVSYVRVY